jgi:F-type H+-transporting ATPase subunit b
MIGQILNSLELNVTFIVQFILIVCTYLIVKIVFLSKLQEVVETRENKTTKLEAEVHKRFAQIDSMANQYKEKIEIAHEEAQKVYQAKRALIIEDQNKKIKEAEVKISAIIDAKRKVLESEVETARVTAVSKVSELAQDLLGRLVK